MLIDREALMDARREAIKTYENASIYNPNAIREGLKPLLDAVVDVPAVDPVHAARACYCRECRRWDDDPDSYGKSDGPKGKCLKSFETTMPDDFCSYGERKT